MGPTVPAAFGSMRLMASVCSMSLGYSISRMCGAPGVLIDSGYACQACGASSTQGRPRCVRVVAGALSTGRGTVGNRVHEGRRAIRSHHLGVAGSNSRMLCQVDVGGGMFLTGATTTSC